MINHPFDYLNYRRGSVRAFVFFSCSALSLAAVSEVHADGQDADGGSSTWMATGYPYLVVDQSLPDVLREFGRNIGVDVQVSDQLKGRVHRYRHDGGSEAFLGGLAVQHGLEWFYDGRRLHFSSGDEALSRAWTVGPASEKALTAALAEVGAGDPRYPIRFDEARGTVSLSGPPAYMAVAMPVVERFVEPAVARTVNVIHGRARSGGS